MIITDHLIIQHYRKNGWGQIVWDDFSTYKNNNDGIEAIDSFLNCVIGHFRVIKRTEVLIKEKND